MRSSESDDDEHYAAYYQELLDAVENYDSRRVGTLILSRSININEKLHHRKTALCLAACNGDSRVVQTLLELNADPSIRCCGLTALHYACKHGNDSVVATLCRYKPKLIWEVGDHGDTPLHMACINPAGNRDCVNMLCELGAFVNATNHNNNTALHELFDGDDDDDFDDRGYEIESAAKTQMMLGAKIDDYDGDDYNIGDGIELIAETLMEFGAQIDARGRDEMTALHMACKKGFIGSVKFLLKNGAAINAQDEYGRTPLHIAVEFKRESVACFLLDSAASASMVDKRKRSPLHVAAEKGTVELVRALLSKGASINEQDGCGRTPLLRAVQFNHVLVVCYLLDKGADADLFDNLDKKFPLLVAVEKGDMELVHALVSKGASINQQDESGSNALCLAVFLQHEKLVYFLLDNGADPNLLLGKKLSPLHFATKSGQAGIVQALVRKGASVNEPSSRGQTALHIASSLGHEATVQFLLENGAAVNTPDKSKNSPLHVSTKNGHLSVVQALLSKGASIDEQNDDGRTPLHVACCYNHLGVVRVLLHNAASVNVIDLCYESPLHLVCESSDINCEIIEALIEYGADVNLSVNEYNGTALSFAICGNSVDAVQILIRHGADVRRVDSDYSDNALHTAAFENETEIINALASMFSSVEKDEAVLYAADNGSLESLKLLVDMGASVDFVDSEGQTALHRASVFESPSCVEFLLSVGAKMEKVDKKGKTPLLLAAASGEAEIVQVLLTAGANVHANDSEGGSALTYACAEKHVRVVRVLLEYEAGVDVMCPHKDVTLLQCLYLQHTDDVMMVDTFEKIIIQMFAAGFKKDRVQKAWLVENFSETCDWRAAAMSRRQAYLQYCCHELDYQLDGNISFLFGKPSEFPAPKITYLQVLKNAPDALAHPGLKSFLQPERKSFWRSVEKQYKMYGRLIRIRLQIAQEREPLIDGGLEFFDRLGVSVYPARMICKYLTNYDLRAISSVV